MRLAFDLTFQGDARPGETGERLVRLADLPALAAGPRSLAGMLWGTRWDVARAIEDEIQPSGVQAAAGLLLAFARARTFELEERNGSVRAVGRAAFLVRALGRTIVAVPRELAGAWRLGRTIKRLTGNPVQLPRPAGAPHRVAYIRSDPTLLWHGAYVGGAATHTTGVINGFRANGLHVHVYAADRPGGIGDTPFTRVPLDRAFHVVHWFTFAAYGERVARAAAAEPADFVYQRYALGSYGGILAARSLDAPLVLEWNGSEIWADKHWGAGRLQRVEQLEALERRELESASLVVVVSDVLRDQLAAEGIDTARVLVNPNGVEVEALESYRARPAADWRGELGMREAPTVGFIGTFGLWHGVLELPDMIERVGRRRPEAHWVLIGAGLLFDEVRDAIASRGLTDRVEMPGVVPHERALELLAACDVCVSPHVPNPDGSPFFGSPTKLFEYMGLGKAIVASDLGQIGEVIEHGQNGLLHPPGDSSAAAEQIASLLGDPRRREQLGAAALEAARTKYSWAAHTQRILDALAR